jgi:importin subunit alpha-2
MCEQSDYEILTDSLWALSYLTDGDEARIDWILSLNILPGLAKNLEQEKVSILIPTIRCIGNIATGNDL